MSRALSEALSFVVLVFILTSSPVLSYEIPRPNVERLPRGGIRVSIPAEPGVEFFAFHANVNRLIEINDVGAIAGTVTNPQNDRWTFQDTDARFLDGDILNFWIYVQANSSAYTRLGHEAFEDGGEARKTVSESCRPSVTLVGGELATCRDRLIFEETFDTEFRSSEYTREDNPSFSREIMLPLDPDYEFCAYRELPNSLIFENGTMSIVPLILDELYGENATLYGRFNLSESCTDSSPLGCSRRAISFNILPPVISARLTTKKSFGFRYGKIEIRAKFPNGDWLYPELWLQPKRQTHGFGYRGGRIILGLARGNEYLTTISSSGRVEYGSTVLEFGLRTGSNNNVREDKITKSRLSGTWNEDFHVYTTIWNEEGFRFKVDGEEVGWIEPARWRDFIDLEGRSEPGANRMSPFDIEFYITIGLGVGGIRIFPDETVSGRIAKPWRNVEAKAMLNFWRAKDTWMPSWGMGNEAKDSYLKLDYVRVWTV